MPLGAWHNLPGRAPRLAVDETVDETRGGAPPHATPGGTPCPDTRYTSMGTDYTGFCVLTVIGAAKGQG